MPPRRPICGPQPTQARVCWPPTAVRAARSEPSSKTRRDVGYTQFGGEARSEVARYDADRSAAPACGNPRAAPRSGPSTRLCGPQGPQTRGSARRPHRRDAPGSIRLPARPKRSPPRRPHIHPHPQDPHRRRSPQGAAGPRSRPQARRRPEPVPPQAKAQRLPCSARSPRRSRTMHRPERGRHPEPPTAGEGVRALARLQTRHAQSFRGSADLGRTLLLWTQQSDLSGRVVRIRPRVTPGPNAFRRSRRGKRRLSSFQGHCPEG